MHVLAKLGLTSDVIMDFVLEDKTKDTRPEY